MAASAMPVATSEVQFCCLLVDAISLVEEYLDLKCCRTAHDGGINGMRYAALLINTKCLSVAGLNNISWRKITIVGALMTEWWGLILSTASLKMGL